jgi:hypothetical protein
VGQSTFDALLPPDPACGWQLQNKWLNQLIALGTEVWSRQIQDYVEFLQVSWTALLES